jgi:hypothetical protein
VDLLVHGGSGWQQSVAGAGMSLHMLQLHTTARHSLTVIEHAPSSWKALRCCVSFIADLLQLSAAKALLIAVPSNCRSGTQKPAHLRQLTMSEL